MFVAFSLASVFGFVFATTAIVAQFGYIARFPRWSRACVLPRAGTTGGRVRNAFTYVVMAPLSPLIAVAVIGDGLRLQNLVLASLGLVSLVAIGTWFVFLFHSRTRPRVIG